MEYRDFTEEEWSNKYWFTGTPPSTSAEWEVLWRELVANEVSVYGATSRVVTGLANNDDSEDAHAVWSIDLRSTSEEIPGTLLSQGGYRMAGDQAGMCQVKTQRKSTRGKWIYLRKYFHDGFIDVVDNDAVTSTTAAAYYDFTLGLTDGTTLPGHVIRSQRQVEDLQGFHASQWVTTRTLKRRGKRP